MKENDGKGYEQFNTARDIRGTNGNLYATHIRRDDILADVRVCRTKIGGPRESTRRI